MFTTRFPSPILCGLAFASLAFIGLPGAASAQPGAPTNLKGYGLMMWQRQHQSSSASRSVYGPRVYGTAPVASTAVVMSNVPAMSSPGTVAVRGPDGVVRIYPVQSGAIQQQASVPGQTTAPQSQGQETTGAAPPVVVTTYACPTRTVRWRWYR